MKNIPGLWKFPCPVTIIIFSIFQCLLALIKISNSSADGTTFMEATTLPFLSQWKLVVTNPALVMTVISLACCLIMRCHNQMSLNIIQCHIISLLILITSNISNQLRLVLLQHWQEMTLSVLNHIGTVMAIIIKALCIWNVLETLLMHPMSCCAERHPSWPLNECVERAPAPYITSSLEAFPLEWFDAANSQWLMEWAHSLRI